LYGSAHAVGVAHIAGEDVEFLADIGRRGIEPAVRAHAVVVHESAHRDIAPDQLFRKVRSDESARPRQKYFSQSSSSPLAGPPDLPCRPDMAASRPSSGWRPVLNELRSHQWIGNHGPEIQPREPHKSLTKINKSRASRGACPALCKFALGAGSRCPAAPG